MDPTTIIVAVIGGIIALLIVAATLRSIVQTIHNLRQPKISVRALVVSKRTDIMGDRGSRTNYYATFEGEGGEREEFPMSGSEYGLLAEGDTGMLLRQGTWFMGFKRQNVAVRR